MPLFRVYVSMPDTSIRRMDYNTDFSAGARELAVKQLQTENVTQYKVQKIKIVAGSCEPDTENTAVISCC